MDRVEIIDWMIPRKLLWYCCTRRVSQRGCKEPTNNTTFSTSAKLGTPFVTWLYTRRTVLTRRKNVL